MWTHAHRHDSHESFTITVFIFQCQFLYLLQALKASWVTHATTSGLTVIWRTGKRKSSSSSPLAMPMARAPAGIFRRIPPVENKVNYSSTLLSMPVGSNGVFQKQTWLFHTFLGLRCTNNRLDVLCCVFFTDFDGNLWERQIRTTKLKQKQNGFVEFLHTTSSFLNNDYLNNRFSPNYPGILMEMLVILPKNPIL